MAGMNNLAAKLFIDSFYISWIALWTLGYLFVFFIIWKHMTIINMMTLFLKDVLICTYLCDNNISHSCIYYSMIWKKIVLWFIGCCRKWELAVIMFSLIDLNEYSSTSFIKWWISIAIVAYVLVLLYLVIIPKMSYSISH